MLLAQYGADVIKVENLDGGDWVRVTAPQPGGNTALSVMGNLGKRSIGIDLKSPDGCAVLWRLLEGADVFMEGFRPGVIARLGFGYEAVSARHPGIIYFSMSGFGQTGPYAERPAMDPVLQAFSGFMAENRDPEGRPMNVASIPVDILSALYAFQALRPRSTQDGARRAGRYIEASLMEGAAWLNTYAMLQRVVYEGNPPWVHSHRGVYQTADGWVFALVAGRRSWRDFCQALERPDLGEDARFATVPDRIAHSAILTPILAVAFAARPNAHWAARLTEDGVMHSVCNDWDEALRDPHVEATGLFSYLAQPGLVAKMPVPRIPGAPALESGTERGTAPLAGADTELVLKAHGFGPQDIEDLIGRGIVGASGP